MATKFSRCDIHQTLVVIDRDECQHRIRSMYCTDINTLITIEQATWPSDSWSYEIFYKYLNDSLWNCWILESTNANTDSSILGYGVQCKLDESNKISCIANICIHPDQRGCGLGGILLRHMIDYARRTGASSVELQVGTSNKHAYMLYDKHGFRIVQVLKEYYSEGSDAYQMQLNFN
jgi:ribosomal-protein-alanine N-acetyltransferase